MMGEKVAAHQVEGVCRRKGSASALATMRGFARGTPGR